MSIAVNSTETTQEDDVFSQMNTDEVEELEKMCDGDPHISPQKNHV
jgi:hypothetical protein